MKIIYIANTSWYLYNFRMNIMSRLLNEGHQIYIIAPRDSFTLKLIESGYIFYESNIDRKSINPIKDFSLLITLIKFIKTIQPEIIHLFTIKPVIYGSIAGRFCGVKKIVASITGLGYAFKQKSPLKFIVITMYRLSLRSNNIISIFQNPDDRAFFIENDLILSKNSYVILGSGVNSRDFKPYLIKKRDKLVFGLFSRMIIEKGVKEFVWAAISIQKNYNYCEFIIAGDVDYGNPHTLSKKWLNDHCKGSIKWLGHIDNVKEIMKETDIVVLPTYYREGIPKCLIEAASMGKPIITTDTPGCREIVKHNLNGKFILPMDSVALVEAIEWFIMNKDQIKRMGEEGRKLVLRYFDEEIIINKTISLYNN